MELTRAKITTFFGKLLRPFPCFSARTIYFSSSIVNCNHHISFFDLFLYLCLQKWIRTRRFGYIDKGLVWSVCLRDLSSWRASFSFNPNHSCLFAVVIPEVHILGEAAFHRHIIQYWTISPNISVAFIASSLKDYQSRRAFARSAIRRRLSTLLARTTSWIFFFSLESSISQAASSKVMSAKVVSMRGLKDLWRSW